MRQIQKKRKNILKKNKYLIIGSAITFVTVVTAIIGFFWTPFSTTAMSAVDKFAAPSIHHIMGADNFGRDIFSRVMKGMGTTIIIAGLTILFSGTAGIIIGALTGFFGGLIDEVIMRINDAINGFPSILLALVMISLLGTGRYNVVLSLSIVFIPSFVRIVRAEYIRIRHADYITSARIMGVNKLRLMFVHILPNTMPAFWSATLIGINNAILAESGLSYLGIGVQPPDASLGKMLSDAQGYLFTAPWYALAPGLMIVLIVLGISLLGEGIRRTK